MIDRRLSLVARIAPMLLALAVAACGDRTQQASGTATGAGADTLPSPASAGGVTGTAEIGPGNEGLAPSLGGTPEAVASETDDATSPIEINPETGLAADPDGDGPLTAPPAIVTGAAEPGAAEAVGVIRDYYAAINARNYARAYGLWASDGNASGQTPQQFAGGFAQTQGVSVEVGAPGREDAGAGQRYLQVPVSLSATQADGSVRRFTGLYVLHRAVADGASPAQRAWRIQSADLREVAPSPAAPSSSTP